jgi:ABC-type branched-subunit amino acid transport system ATPase component
MGSNNSNILELKNVSKSFGGVKAVDNVSIGFMPNTITGLIGPNGAGKTTLFNLISGLLRLDEGQIFYKNKRIDTLKPHQRSNLGIGRLFQDVRVFNKLTCLENILIALPNQPGEKVYETIFKQITIKKAEAENIIKAEELLDFVGLIDKRDSLAENLSFGQQKLLAIARLLIMNAELLLLDEPTAGVHPQLINKILELIKNLGKNGKTIIFIEHNINVVLEIADWLYLLDDGKVVAFGLPYEVLEDKITKEVYLGV